MRTALLFLLGGLISGAIPVAGQINVGAKSAAVPGKPRVGAPLTLYPACPCYHTIGEGKGETRVDARVNLDPARRAGLRLRVQLSDAAGKTIQIATVDASQGKVVGVTLRVPVERAGVFGITAALLERAGKEVGRADTDVHVIPPEEARVEVGPDGFLRVGGRPQFPIGLYSAGHYTEMGRAGFSATHYYGIVTGAAEEQINPNEPRLKRLLDQSWTNGMRMMVELPRKAIEKAQWTQVRRRIQTFRHHPGLLCWGSEERVARGTAPLANIAALYRLVHELDPDHPLVLGDTKDVIKKFRHNRRDFFPDACMDAGIWWWYPIPLKEPDGNGVDGRGPTAGRLLEPPSWLTTTLSKKPLWIAIQSYQRPKKDARFPTPAEYRCMAYLSIISGVKGLWFYTGFGEKDYYGKPAGLLNRPEEAHWDYVQKLVAELRQFSPVIMAPHGTAKLELSPAAAPVAFTTRQLEGKLYLLAANKSERAQAVRFSGGALKGTQVRVLFESCQAGVREGALQDVLPPYGARVYVFE